jgi:hypothetical protein
MTPLEIIRTVLQHTMESLPLWWVEQSGGESRGKAAVLSAHQLHKVMMAVCADAGRRLKVGVGRTFLRPARIC